MVHLLEVDDELSVKEPLGVEKLRGEAGSMDH